jgi:hypothetical protein
VIWGPVTVSVRRRRVGITRFQARIILTIALAHDASLLSEEMKVVVEL